MAIDYQKIGLKIQNSRLDRKMTQEELAEAVSYSAAHISAIERGVKVPSVQTIVAIANALGITSDDLLADVLENLHSEEVNRIQALLLDCTSDKKNILLQAMSALKTILTEHGI